MVYAALSLAMLAITFRTACSYSEYYYTAAVYEHARLINISTPSEMIQANLAYYRNAAEVAKSKGADIIVFPEYGIFPPADRSELKAFLEDIPNPKEVRANPCLESEEYSDKPIIHALSCIARNNTIVVVANTGDIKRCQEQQNCPEDGDFHYNTNVAFDSDGTLIGRYHKERLFFEAGMDLPQVRQDPTFNTSFGKFGMFVCFDLVFQRITEVAKQGVEAVLLPTMWIDPAPLMWSVQIWQSWAIGNNITFMAANIQMPGYLAVGSGIFNGVNGPIAYTYNPDGKSKLVVAQVPRSQYQSNPLALNSSTTVITNNGTESYDNDGSQVPDECSEKILNQSTSIYTDYRCLEEDTANYTFVKLEQPEGHLEACNYGMCCSLDYSASDMQESYFLGVYNGTYNMFNRYFWWQENCLLVRCDAFGNNSCATFPMKSKTIFHNIHLRANVTTEYVYPSVLGSGIRLVPTSEWQHGIRNNTAYITYSSPTGRDLLVVGLNGRKFSKDPPYIR